LTAVDYYFKLDPNIRNPTEVLFAKMEIEGLAQQKVEPIRHFYDVIKQQPISYFDNENARIQDFLLNIRTVYGQIQGYHFSNELLDLTRFIERLAYTREIYVCLELENDVEIVKRTLFPFGVEGKNLQVWVSSIEGKHYCLLRIITNMFFLEQINNIILCSAGKTRERQIERMDGNIVRLITHVMENVRTYIPKFPKDSNYKEFEDFVDEPNEITLYLTQFYGPPYKAKFHPRMIRALLNFANVGEEQKTADFMLGSGTLAIESVLLNVRTKGSDINPLAEIVTKAKIDALSFEPNELLEEIDGMAGALLGTEIPTPDVKPFLARYFQGKENMRNGALFLNEYIRKKIKEKYRNFFLCALARVSSAAYKMKNEPDVFCLIEKELWNMWKVVYCFNEMKRFLHVPIADAEITTDDVTTLKSVEEESIDLIVTSPPYSTAIDYVKMDLAQLLLLGLIESPKELDEKMMGTHRKTADIDELVLHVTSSEPILMDGRNRFHRLPSEAQKYILSLRDDDKSKNALRCYRFLYNMWDGLEQMHRVLKRGKGECIIIIGNNVFAVKGEDKEFRNGDFLEEMALNSEIGFSKWRDKLVREYSKSSYGTILKEDIIFLNRD
jgi:tRNA G10  N-methylase Trm11